ncbi:MAG: DEAD/DEAH box helicase, partial [candidate division Zixibacteria bacterium]|nr:DEAD/DEAH box helicase [candidate division Zixibacteria bacterium]
MFADVVIPQVPVSPFTYSIPEKLSGWLEVGMRVTVPVKDRKHTGFVIGTQPETEVTRIKEIISFKEPVPVIGESFIELVKWVSDYYICGLAECFQAALPSKLMSLPECYLQLDDKSKLAASEIPEQFPFETDIRRIKAGVQSGDYHVSYKRIRLLKDTEIPDLEIAGQNLAPNDSQQAAIDGILHDIGQKSIRNYLLFGVTGSGKTLVYIEIMRRLLREGRSVLIMVPEISLTPVMQKRFTDIFGDNVVVLHSRLTPAQRLRRWERARRGIGKIVLGPRSSVFVPIPNLSLIVVDEEQDHSYKQESPAPRYNARDVALMRGKIEKVPVIMGSATPSIESFHNAQNGKFELLRLPERPG